MTTVREDAEAKIGMEIRSNHPSAYRSGQWAEIIDVRDWDGGVCYVVLWPDGRDDLWPIVDGQAKYEYRGEKQVFEVDPEMEMETTPEQHPGHTWELRHQLNRHGMATGKAMRTECSCAWRGTWKDTPVEAIAQWEAHLHDVVDQ